VLTIDLAAKAIFSALAMVHDNAATSEIILERNEILLFNQCSPLVVQLQDFHP
jgi:hypothetical protein